MATQVQFRGGTTSQHGSFTGAVREVTVDTDKETLVVHDGSTAGGFEISRADASNLTFAVGSDIKTTTAGTNNFRAGLNAGNSITSNGNENVLVGDEAGTALTTGDDNVAIGYRALSTEDTGSRSVAIGHDALRVQNNDSTNYNVAVGFGAGEAITTATLNTLIGGLAGDAINTGGENVALGYNALSGDVKGNNSVAIGSKALQVQSFSGATDVYNTAVGHNAGKSVTTGVQNVLIGARTGDALTDADFNVAVGQFALSSDTQGSKSTAIGEQALSTQNFSSATDSHNTAVGFKAGLAVTNGVNNTLLGALAGNGITTGTRNTALGYRSLSGAVDDGLNNTCVGSDAGLVTTGSQNCFVGGYDPSTGGSGAEVTTGSKNTILGSYNGNQNGLDIRTSSNNVVLSDGDGNVRLHADSNGALLINGASAHNARLSIKFNATLSGANGRAITMTPTDTDSATFIHFHNVGVSTIGSISGNGSNIAYNTSSDYRLKENVDYSWDATTRLKQLKPARFNWIADEDNTLVDGFIAHEVSSVVPEAITGEKDATNEDGSINPQGIDQSKLVPLLVKTIQELEARITALEGA